MTTNLLCKLAAAPIRHSSTLLPSASLLHLRRFSVQTHSRTTTQTRVPPYRFSSWSWNSNGDFAKLVASGIIAGTGFWASACENEPALRLVEAQDVAPLCTPPRFLAFCALFRFLHILMIFFPIAVALPFCLLNSRTYQMWFSMLIWSLETAGPTFIKLGQWASTRPDILPSRLCYELSCLHNNVRPLSPSTTRLALEQSLGQSVDQLFVSFDNEPVGSGCIAQVHRAVLRQSGRDVAVKIRRPGVVEQVWLDLLLLRSIAGWLDKLPNLKPLHFPEIVLYFSHFMTNQLDFSREAANLQRFRTNFKANKCVVFPEPLQQYSKDDVLLESYEAGESLSDYLRALPPRLLAANHNNQISQNHHSSHHHHNQNDHGSNRGDQTQMQTSHLSDKAKKVAKANMDSELKQLADTAVDMFLKMVFVDNFVHGDLHPGNMLVHRSGSSSSLVVIDAGLVTELTSTDRKNFVDLVIAVVNGDGFRAAEIMVERSIYENKVLDFPAFQAGMEQIVGQVKTTSFLLSKVQIGEVLSNVMGLVRKHRVHMDPVFANMVISIGVLEGVGRQLSPDTDLFKRIIPLLPHAQDEYLKGAVDLVVALADGPQKKNEGSTGNVSGGGRRRREFQNAQFGDDNISQSEGARVRTV
eukprot:c3857_g1_i1.p1 GENE.c3857_g1_i1~~c3857_g1_i1.p1  ORF type:complete len:672 (+),score=147.33 c3857_g1_i1:101-2017(+)